MPVKGLIHYALEVPDPVVGETFNRDFGLTESGSKGNSLKLATSKGSGELLLFEGPKERLHHVALAAPGDDFEAVRAAIKAAGIPELTASRIRGVASCCGVVGSRGTASR